MHYTPTAAVVAAEARELTALAAVRAAYAAPIDPQRPGRWLLATRAADDELTEAHEVVQAARRACDPAAYQAHQEWRNDCAGHDYELSQTADYYLEA